MFVVAELLGVRIGEVEKMSTRELLEWAAWLKVKTEKPKQTPDQMRAILKRAQTLG